MVRFALGAAAVLCLMFVGVLPARGQLGPRYFDASNLERLGLEQAWSTHVQLDSTRAQSAALHLQVVGMDSYAQLQELVYRVYEVQYDGRTIRFSQNDVDAAGDLLGRDEAQRLAEKQMILLQARGLKPELVTRDIPPTTVYAQSNRGTLQAVDGETGKTLWAVTLGQPQHPLVGPAANDRFVSTVSGSTLHLLDRVTGAPIWDRTLGVNPVLSICMSDQFVFVPGLGGQVEGYHLPTAENNQQVNQPWVYHSGAAITASPATTRSTVSWATDSGQMFVASLDGPLMMYRRQTGGAIYGRSSYLPPDRLVIASSDGYVTAMNEMDGSPVWQFSTGDDLQQAPFSLPDSVYIVTRQHRLFSINSQDGSEQWTAPGIEQVLASGQDRLYVRGGAGALLALDKQTGKRIASLSASAYGLGLSNELTDRLYLLSQDGTLLCLREIDAQLPTIRRPLPEPPSPAEAPAERPSRAVAPAGDAETSAPAADDEPVAADDDPFGDGVAEPAPAAGDAPVEEQPAEEPASEEPAADEPAADEPADGDAEQPADEGDVDDPFDFG